MKKLLAKIKLRYFAGKVARITKREVIRGIMREDKEPSFFPQEEYETCEDRIKALFAYMTSRPVKIVTLATCDHRFTTHNEEKRIVESNSVSEKMSSKDIQTAKASKWWVW